MYRQAHSTHMPLKVNTTGVIPPIFASSLLLLPLTLVGFIGADKTPASWGQVSAQLAPRQAAAYMVLYAALIVFFVFFYTADRRSILPRKRRRTCARTGALMCPGSSPVSQHRRLP